MQIPTFLDANDTGKQAIGLGARQILSGWEWSQDSLSLFPQLLSKKNVRNKTKQKQKTTSYCCLDLIARMQQVPLTVPGMPALPY